jgi:NADP-dependent 3-hydroxy acid dehydrogenase YdfG
LVTGGGSGIGPEIAKSFAISGAAAISLVGRTEKTLIETKSRLEKEFPKTKFFTFVADIVDREVLDAAFDQSVVAAGLIDVLVANAGVMTDLVPLAKSNSKDWDYSIDINVRGSYNTVTAFLRNAAKNASVVHVSTGILSLQYIPGQAAYREKIPKECCERSH